LVQLWFHCSRRRPLLMPPHPQQRLAFPQLPREL
jgi:hypothetical protein